MYSRKPIITEQDFMEAIYKLGSAFLNVDGLSKEEANALNKENLKHIGDYLKENINKLTSKELTNLLDFLKIARDEIVLNDLNDLIKSLDSPSNSTRTQHDALVLKRDLVVDQALRLINMIRDILEHPSYRPPEENKAEPQIKVDPSLKPEINMGQMASSLKPEINMGQRVLPSPKLYAKNADPSIASIPSPRGLAELVVTLPASQKGGQDYVEEGPLADIAASFPSPRELVLNSPVSKEDQQGRDYVWGLVAAHKNQTDEEVKHNPPASSEQDLVEGPLAITKDQMDEEVKHNSPALSDQDLLDPMPATPRKKKSLKSNSRERSNSNVLTVPGEDNEDLHSRRRKQSPGRTVSLSRNTGRQIIDHLLGSISRSPTPKNAVVPMSATHQSSRRRFFNESPTNLVPPLPAFAEKEEKPEKKPPEAPASDRRKSW